MNFLDNEESANAERSANLWKDLDEIIPKPSFRLCAPPSLVWEKIGSKTRPSQGVWCVFSISSFIRRYGTYPTIALCRAALKGSKLQPWTSYQTKYCTHTCSACNCVKYRLRNIPRTYMLLLTCYNIHMTHYNIHMTRYNIHMSTQRCTPTHQLEITAMPTRRPYIRGASNNTDKPKYSNTT